MSDGSQSFSETLIQTFDDPGFRPPPLPGVALELMALAARDDVDASDVVRVLEHDEMLAATVLRLVGSPIYCGRVPIRTLEDAVIRLGFDLVRDVVFEAALSRGVFQLPLYASAMEQIRRHSTVTAYIARLVCKHADVDPEHAFVCGLLHDVGFAALLFAVTHVQSSRIPPLIEISDAIDGSHERGSELLTKLWGLPDHIAQVVSHHHHLHTGEDMHVVAAVSIADHMSESFGANVLGPLDVAGVPLPGDAVSDVDYELSAGVLGLSAEDLAAINQEAEELVPNILWL